MPDGLRFLTANPPPPAPLGVLKAVEHINKTLGPALLEKARGSLPPCPAALLPSHPVPPPGTCASSGTCPES